ncbi:hypothetical protein [Citrobacter sp. RHBSTW-00271]|uniref:hypothetical protein n=1 Tax=Citrobacter sp. RHBSTW-00271 TaxID=2742642 RepID=UPI0015F885C6|nr:hypothetical protein [Citrobacter sp. RHBSTW-00271]MBA7942500.1 hypothetical protein [Citrobacter sp. RHBSTW-00271]
MDVVTYECDYSFANEAFAHCYSLYKKMNYAEPQSYISRELKNHAAVMSVFTGDHCKESEAFDLRQDVVVSLVKRHIEFPGISKPLDVALRLNYIGEYLHFLKRSGGSEYIYLGYLYLNSGFDINELVKWLAYNKQQKKSDRLKNNAKKGGNARSAKLAMVQSKTVELLKFNQAAGAVWRKKTDAVESIKKELLEYIEEMNISLSTTNIEITVLNWSRDVEAVKNAFTLVVRKNSKK